jgi:TonB family protein
VSVSGMKNWIALGLLAVVVGGFAVPQAMGEDRKLKSEVKPTYPELAKKMNVGGAVKIEVVILPNGAVKSAKALGGHPLLIEPSLDAAKKCKFEAATSESTQVIVFNFSKPQ